MANYAIAIAVVAGVISLFGVILWFISGTYTRVKTTEATTISTTPVDLLTVISPINNRPARRPGRAERPP
mgnify:CR=1 FL=1